MMGCGCKSKIKSAAQTVAKGAVGLTKAVIGLEQAPLPIIEERRGICRGCEHAKPCPLLPARKCTCSKCGCVLKAKTTLAGESCPIGKWAAVEIGTTEPSKAI